jgi:cytochrome c biogenesis protein
VKLKRLLLSRGTVLTIIALLTAMIVVATLVPQSFTTPAEELAAWRARHPLLAGPAAWLGLHHVYTHALFAGLLLLALLALSLSALEQLRTALRRTWPREARASGAGVELPAAIDAVARTLRSRGYLTVRRTATERLLVRHPWGYWGNFFLHLGLVIVVGASTLIGLTQQRASVHLLEGERFESGGPWFGEENGVAASRLVLPFTVRLDHLEYRFWPTYGLESVVSTLSLLRPSGPPATLRVGINDLQQVEGLRIYQGVEIGHAFRVDVEQGGDRRTATLLIQHPDTPDAPGVNDFRGLLPGGELLRAKYFVDAERKSFETFNPLLVLRVDGPGGSLGEARLRPGTSGEIGPYRLHLARVTLWTRLFFVHVTGIPGVFAGFLVIAVGGVLHYFTPPREAALAETGSGSTRMVWRAARFADFYVDELDGIRAAVAPGGRRG